MSLNENITFIDEFNRLDKILKEIYGYESKLGITLYLEHMDSLAFQGKYSVSNWTSDYEILKNLRNKRNYIIHEAGLNEPCFTKADIEWICNFRKRIMSQNDPVAMLMKHQARTIKKIKQNVQPEYEERPLNSPILKNKNTSSIPLILTIVIPLVLFLFLVFCLKLFYSK